MSKIVVGMNSRPGDHPAEDRLRIAEDDAERATGALAASRRAASAASRPGSSSEEQHALIARPATPMPIQNVLHGTPAAISGPDDELAGRAAGHAEHLGRADQRRRARRGEVRRRDVGRADQREHAAGALQKPADARQPGCCPVANSSAPTPTAAAPIGTTLRGPSRSIADAGDQAERRVAVVEEPDHRRDARRAEAERLRQLRHHHRRRRAQRVLIEVVHRRDQPGDRCGSSRRAHPILVGRGRLRNEQCLRLQSRQVRRRRQRSNRWNFGVRRAGRRGVSSPRRSGVPEVPPYPGGVVTLRPAAPFDLQLRQRARERRVDRRDFFVGDLLAQPGGGALRALPRPSPRRSCRPESPCRSRSATWSA